MMMKIKKKYTKPSTRLIELGPDVAVLQGVQSPSDVEGEHPTTDPSQGGEGDNTGFAKEMNFDFDFEY